MMAVDSGMILSIINKEVDVRGYSGHGGSTRQLHHKHIRVDAQGHVFTMGLKQD